MRYEKQTTIAASPAAVWAVLADIGSWPEWTPTFESVEVAHERLATGSVVTIKQPGRRRMRYRVSRVQEGRSFCWGRSSGGVTQSADHVLEPTDQDSCRLTLSFTMSGPVGSLLGALGGRTIRSMVDTEAASLKKRVES